MHFWSAIPNLHKMNAGKEGGVFFYRDSNMNEVDVLIKEDGEITALEVKSSMTYNRDFETTLKNCRNG